MTTRSLSQFSNEVVALISQLHRGLFKRHTDALGRGMITIPQYTCLDLLDNQGPLKMNDIARFLGVSLPATTGLIKRLCTLSYVKRTYDHSDRRVIRIVLTARGKRVSRSVRDKRKKFVTQLFSRLSVRERDQYLALLRKVTGGIKN